VASFGALVVIPLAMYGPTLEARNLGRLIVLCSVAGGGVWLLVCLPPTFG